MKTIRDIYEKIASFENLYTAFLRARRGKRYREYAIEFEKDLEENLLQLSSELKTHTYKPGIYRTFYFLEVMTFKVISAIGEIGRTGILACP